MFVVYAPEGITDIRYWNAPLDESSKQNGIKLDLGSKSKAALVVFSSTTARIQEVSGIADDKDALLPAVSVAVEKESIVCRGMFAGVFDGPASLLLSC